MAKLFLLLMLPLLLACARKEEAKVIPKPIERFIVDNVSYLKIHTAVVREDYFVSLVQERMGCRITTAHPKASVVNDTLDWDYFYLYDVSECPSVENLGRRSD